MTTTKSFKAGFKFDDFELLESLGGGQDGEVWKAKKLSLGKLGQECAIKFLNIANDEDKLQRFEREIDALSRLSHPYIVSIRERGTAQAPGTRNVVPYYVMDYIPGKQLKDALICLSLDDRLPAVCTFFEQILLALDEIHKNNLTHGDIKSANILVLLDTMVAKLSDFGFSIFKDEIRSRKDYPSSSHPAPSELDSEQADLYRLGKTLIDCLQSIPFSIPQKAKLILDSLKEDLLMLPAQTSQNIRSSAINRLKQLKMALSQQVIPEFRQVSDSISKIYDPFHGDVPLSSRSIAIIDSPPFQYLRKIPAFPLESLVFPSLSGNLFEMVIGEFAALRKALLFILADIRIREAITDDNLSSLFCASLTRCLGQHPFEHLLENSFQGNQDKYNRLYHIIQEEPLRYILIDKWKIHINTIMEILAGNFYEGGDSPLQILSWFFTHLLSPLKIEWMRRMAWGCGYSFPDVDQLYSNMTLVSHQWYDRRKLLVFNDLAVTTIEDILRAWLFILKRVLHDETVMAAQFMLEKAFAQIAECDRDFDSLYSATDMFLDRCYDLAKKIGNETSIYLIKEYRERRIFKLISFIKLSERSIRAVNHNERIQSALMNSIAKKMSRKLCIDEKDFVIGFPYRFAFEVPVMILNNRNVVKIEDISPICKNVINDIYQLHQILYVYASRKVRDNLDEKSRYNIKEFLEYEISLEVE